MKYDKKNILYYSLITILSISVLILFIIVAQGKTEMFDFNVLLSISSIRSPILTRLMIFISEFCNMIFIFVVVLFLLLLVKEKTHKFLVVINTLGAYLLTGFIKLIFARPRPIIFMLVNEKSYSYPSGHALISTAFYGILAYLCYKNIENKYWKYISPFLLIILSIAISFSRLYLGVHYLTDVMTGILIGVIIILIEIKVIKKGK